MLLTLKTINLPRYQFVYGSKCVRSLDPRVFTDWRRVSYLMTDITNLIDDVFKVLLGEVAEGSTGYVDDGPLCGRLRVSAYLAHHVRKGRLLQFILFIQLLFRSFDLNWSCETVCDKTEYVIFYNHHCAYTKTILVDFNQGCPTFLRHGLQHFAFNFHPRSICVPRWRTPIMVISRRWTQHPSLRMEAPLLKRYGGTKGENERDQCLVCNSRRPQHSRSSLAIRESAGTRIEQWVVLRSRSFFYPLFWATSYFIITIGVGRMIFMLVSHR